MDARWTELSSDLSSKDPTRIVPSGGIFGDHLGQLFPGEVVFSIAASDVQMGLIRAGTSDGKGWYTKGAGKNRNDVTKNITGLRAWGVVSRIEASLGGRYFFSSALTHHKTGACPCALPF
jgi:hypothetical protein